MLWFVATRFVELVRGGPKRLTQGLEQFRRCCFHDSDRILLAPKSDAELTNRSVPGQGQEEQASSDQGSLDDAQCPCATAQVWPEQTAGREQRTSVPSGVLRTHHSSVWKGSHKISTNQG